jgi:uncharacterized membrane protein YidH (DUF202 family)
LERFRPLVERGLLTPDGLGAVEAASAFRGVDAERVLLDDFQIPRRKVLEALSAYYGCPWIEYDERLPVPVELLARVDGAKLCESLWFPAMMDGDTLVVAASDPFDPLVMEQARKFIPAGAYSVKVALVDDIAWLIQDFLHAAPDRLVGNERTGLALWRNNMARWRTRLACYRTDFATARTHFGALRWGLGLISACRTLLHVHPATLLGPLYWIMIALGFALVVAGVSSYVKLRSSIMSPPRPQTLVEVTAATLYFLEDYQFVPKKKGSYSARRTMLSRLSDLLPNSCVFIQNSPDNKVRSFLAHERNSLAAQRTVLACYRTIYSRARTGLSFIRTGVGFISIGLGLIQYFGLSLLTLLDCFVVLGGTLMVADGIVWYWPVRKEQREAPEPI